MERKIIVGEYRARTGKKEKSGLSKGVGWFIKAVGNLVFGALLLLIAFLAFSLISVKVSGQPPAVAGHRMYIVSSGSMQPAFSAGSLIFVKPAAPKEIKTDDIITYRGLGGQEQLISHRVVTVNDTDQDITFTTKGDANDVTDPNPVAGKNLVGKVALAIPYLGYFMEYSRTKQGILFIVLIPGTLLFVYEAVILYRTRKARKKAKHVQYDSQKDIRA